MANPGKLSFKDYIGMVKEKSPILDALIEKLIEKAYKQKETGRRIDTRKSRTEILGARGSWMNALYPDTDNFQMFVGADRDKTLMALKDAGMVVTERQAELVYGDPPKKHPTYYYWILAYNGGVLSMQMLEEIKEIAVYFNVESEGKEPITFLHDSGSFLLEQCRDRNPDRIFSTQTTLLINPYGVFKTATFPLYERLIRRRRIRDKRMEAGICSLMEAMIDHKLPCSFTNRSYSGSALNI
jgi:hypothetical protein